MSKAFTPASCLSSSRMPSNALRGAPISISNVGKVGYERSTNLYFECRKSRLQGIRYLGRSGGHLRSFYHRPHCRLPHLRCHHHLSPIVLSWNIALACKFVATPPACLLIACLLLDATRLLFRNEAPLVCSSWNIAVSCLFVVLFSLNKASPVVLSWNIA